MRRPQYAREFIASLMELEDGLSAKDALRQTIEIMGVKEFSEPAAFHPQITLDQLLKPFKLRTKIVLKEES